MSILTLQVTERVKIILPSSHAGLINPICTSTMEEDPRLIYVLLVILRFLDESVMDPDGKAQGCEVALSLLSDPFLIG